MKTSIKITFHRIEMLWLQSTCNLGTIDMPTTQLECCQFSLPTSRVRPMIDLTIRVRSSPLFDYLSPTLSSIKALSQLTWDALCKSYKLGTYNLNEKTLSK